MIECLNILIFKFRVFLKDLCKDEVIYEECTYVYKYTYVCEECTSFLIHFWQYISILFLFNFHESIRSSSHYILL